MCRALRAGPLLGAVLPLLLLLVLLFVLLPGSLSLLQRIQQQGHAAAQHQALHARHFRRTAQPGARLRLH